MVDDFQCVVVGVLAEDGYEDGTVGDQEVGVAGGEVVGAALDLFVGWEVVGDGIGDGQWDDVEGLAVLVT